VIKLNECEVGMPKAVILVEFKSLHSPGYYAIFPAENSKIRIFTGQKNVTSLLTAGKICYSIVTVKSKFLPTVLGGQNEFLPISEEKPEAMNYELHTLVKEPTNFFLR